MIKQDILEKQAKSSYLAIGSNLGDRFANIQLVEKLLVLNNIYINDTSSYYETPSWPNRKFPKFFNIVLKIKTDMSLIGLFKTVKKGQKKLLKVKMIYDGPIEAPVKKDQIVAKLKIIYDQNLIGEYELLSLTEVRKVNIFSRLLKSFNYLIWGDV